MTQKKSNLCPKALTEAQKENTQIKKEKTENWNLWCKNSEEKDRSKNGSEEDDLPIYYNQHAAE